jgi:hypothetical protein
MKKRVRGERCVYDIFVLQRVRKWGKRIKREVEETERFLPLHSATKCRNNGYRGANRNLLK